MRKSSKDDCEMQDLVTRPDKIEAVWAKLLRYLKNQYSDFEGEDEGLLELRM